MQSWENPPPPAIDKNFGSLARKYTFRDKFMHNADQSKLAFLIII